MNGQNNVRTDTLPEEIEATEATLAPINSGEEVIATSISGDVVYGTEGTLQDTEYSLDPRGN